MFKIFNTKTKSDISENETILLSENNIVLNIIEQQIKEQVFLSLQKYIYRMNSFLIDKQQKYIYEYDFIEMIRKEDKYTIRHTGVVIKKNGRFVVTDIRRNGELVKDDKFKVSLKDIIDYYYVKVINIAISIDEYNYLLRNDFRFKVMNYQREKINNCYLGLDKKVYRIKETDNKIILKEMGMCKYYLFTGIYDSNGLDLYRKDYVKFKLENGKTYTGQINFIDGAFYITNINHNKIPIENKKYELFQYYKKGIIELQQIKKECY